MHGVGPLLEAVQKNCHISDARHARDLTLCTYLLEMREYYRWEHDLPLALTLPRDHVGRWLTEREVLWNELEADAFEPLPLAGRRHDPFDSAAINRDLLPQRLVYGGGYGRFRMPQFFLAELERLEERDGVPVLITGCEYARGLATLPAAYQDGAIYLRRDALTRWLWEKMELWGARQAPGPLRSAAECYGFAAGAEAALAAMAEAEGEAVILHELGEAAAERLLGGAWAEMLAGLESRRAELLARAVRDNLADCVSTLPVLIERDARGSLHFYFSQFEGLRRLLFPALAAAYGRWRECGDPAGLRETALRGREHWEGVARRLLALHASGDGGAEHAFERLLEQEPCPLAL